MSETKAASKSGGKSQSADTAAKKSSSRKAHSVFDHSGFDKETIVRWYALNHLGRKLDEKAASYLKMAKGWSYHAPCAGHDGIQLAIGQIFRPNKDFFFPYYRDLISCLSAGLSPLEIIYNGLSKDADVAGGGRHMSNHFAKPSIRIQNGSSCTGNHSLHAAGVARAIKKFKGDELAIYSGGESACSEGYFYEAVNGACTEKLPVIFVIQNNKFGISVPVREQSANERISDNFVGFRNLLIVNCDGRDVFDSYRAMRKAADYVLSGAGPAMVHADCDRIGSHSNSDNQELYRPADEIAEAKSRDPLPRFRALLIESGIMTEADIVALEQENVRKLYEAADIAEVAPDPEPSSYTEFQLPPAAASMSDASEYRYANDVSRPQLTFREAINHAMKEEFHRNPATFLWGQDVASVNKQGIFNVPKGMLDEFGNERIFNAPIAEDFIVGTANGMCRYRKDIRVVVEGAEFADYFWPAMEQMIECSHEYWRTKGQYTPNLVIRLASGGYIQGGLYHSQNLDAILSHLPGMRVVCPAFADDAIGLMRNAIRSEGTSFFLEPKYLYNYRPTAASVPDDDFIIPFGRAKVRRKGDAITIVSYGNAIHLALESAKELEQHGYQAEVIDLRSLRPWDKEMVCESAKRCSRVLVAHEHYLSGGIGGEVAATVTSECFPWLDAPVARVASKDVPVGFAKNLEKAILLNVNDITQAALSTLKY